MTANNAQLKSIIDRALNLHEQKDNIGQDLKDLFAEAKSNGYDVAALKEVIKLQREDASKREKRETKESILETYLQALGILADTPLGQAAVRAIG
jgi:uncharacterized protein (UPF0335 family)